MNYEELQIQNAELNMKEMDLSEVSGLSGLYFNGNIAIEKKLTQTQKTCVLAEELGLVGILILLALYILLIMRGLWIAARAQTTFGRVMAGGLMLILFVYVFVNIGMVSGILPVVGVPLPLVSYGGSALIVLMAGFGIVMSIHTHRKMLSKSV